MAAAQGYQPPLIDPFWNRLADILLDLAVNNQIAIAFSGGLDSRFLAHAAQLVGLRPILLHATGPHIAPGESEWARSWAKLRGLELIELTVDPLELNAVAAGSESRCYDCKTGLFTAFAPVLSELDLREASNHPEQDFAATRGIVLCDGSNASDNNVFRPGMRAVREFGVHSPLAAAGLDKACLRQLARETGLERPEQHPRPCLLTRLDYGLHPNAPLLINLGEAEARVEAILCRNSASSPDAPLDPDSAPDFRLRLFKAERLELHIATPLTPEVQSAIHEAVYELGLPKPVIVTVNSVSGYYDALRGVQ